jgi:hypothetical protein
MALRELSPPSRPIKRLRLRMKSDSSFTASDVETTFEWMGEGFWGRSTSATKPDLTSQTQTVTVCGIFDAVSLSGSSVGSDTPLILPLGKIFVPFGVQRTTSKLNVTSKMTSLRVNPTAACVPKAGESFDFEAKMERELIISGPVPSTRVIPVVLRGHCDISNAIPASALNPGFIGAYLPVTCQRTTQSGASSSVSYAFLIDSGIYVLLDEKAERLHSEYTVSSVEYAN